MNYIWFNDESPILNQLPLPFQSAAILLHPFVRMPSHWAEQRRQFEFEHIYPKTEEVLQLAHPVSWSEIMNDTGLATYGEVALALKTSIHAFRKEFARDDLADLLRSNRKPDLYYPLEDQISAFLLKDILEVLSSKGSETITFSNPIFDQSGILRISETSPIQISDLSPVELILTNESMEYAFMSVYDSFITLFLSSQNDIREIVQSKKWEAIICDEKTYISWFFNRA